MNLTTTDIVNIFTDGACSGNPGMGGASAIIKYKDQTKSVSGYLPLATNNQMELLAAIIGLNCLKRSCEVNLFTDSVYLKNGITIWSKKWQTNNWRTANKKPVKNLQLWQKLIELSNIHIISWHWIKGHNGHTENEEADQKARDAIHQQGPLITAHLQSVQD